LFVAPVVKNPVHIICASSYASDQRLIR
jgi:hypothetical protein